MGEAAVRVDASMQDSRPRIYTTSSPRWMRHPARQKCPCYRLPYMTRYLPCEKRPQLLKWK